MRIASLLPSATDIVAALGLADHLVAISHECDLPPNAPDLPRITASRLPAGLDPAAIDGAVKDAAAAGRPLYQVDGDLLSELEPDLVLTQGLCEVCAVTESQVGQALRRLPDHLPRNAQVLSLSGTTVSGIFADIRAVADSAGVPAQAETLLGQLNERWRAVETSAPAERPPMAVLEWTDPVFVGGHWVPEMIAAAGGVDLLASPGAPSRRADWSEVAAADPDIVVVAACGYRRPENTSLALRMRDHPVAGRLRAVEAGRLWAVDANAYFSRPGPGVVRGAEILSAVARDDPDAVDPMEAVRITAV